MCGKFWYKDYGLPHHDGLRADVRVVGLAQQKALPLLERLRQLLEDKQPMSLSPSTYWQHIGGTKQSLPQQIAPDSYLLIVIKCSKVLKLSYVIQGLKRRKKKRKNKEKRERAKRHLKE